MPKPWNGSVFPYRGFWHVQWKAHGASRFTKKRTKWPLADASGEKKARALLERMREQLDTSRPFLAGASGEVTVHSYATRWLETRRARPSYADDVSRLREHVYPVLGDLPIAEVRPRHIKVLRLELTTKKAKVLVKGKKGRVAGSRVLAPRTQRSVLALISTLFADAVEEELIEQTPIVRRRGNLPKAKDADPTWRATAIFTLDEVERLISDERIPFDRRVCYALYYLTGARFGEISALRWWVYETDARPLHRLRILVSYNTRLKLTKDTKNEKVRSIPVHPVLARLLADWKDHGWAEMLDRPPTPQDLIVPSRTGANRSVNHMLKRFRQDLEQLGLRARRQHDARRTFNSAALNGGADREAVGWILEGRPNDVQGLYTEAEWSRLCGAVKCIPVKLRKGSSEQRTPAREQATKRQPENLLPSAPGLASLAAFREKTGGVYGTRTLREHDGNRRNAARLVGIRRETRAFGRRIEPFSSLLAGSRRFRCSGCSGFCRRPSTSSASRHGLGGIRRVECQRC